MNKKLCILVPVLLVAVVNLVNFGSGTLFGNNNVINECSAAENSSVVAEGAKLIKLVGDFKFTEGPVEDSDGGVYFTDDPLDRIFK